MSMLRFTLGGLMSLMSVPSMAAESGIQTLAVDGSCERLVISGEDVSAQCGTALVHILDDGVVDVFVGTGGQGLFGLAGPERMVIFRGSVTKKHEAWTDHDVDLVLLGTRVNDSVDMVEVSGACSYEDPAEGVAVTVCEASDRLGRSYSLRYQTDGLPPVEF